MRATGRSGRLLATLLLCALLRPHAARAWGCAAHRLIADLATERLSPAARATVATLLDPGESLADVSCWADIVRSARPETARWHYVDIPRAADRYVPARDCRLEAGGDCLIAAIDRFVARLADRSAPADDRREALRFLAHLVADLHQPLHCTGEDDRGGNDVHVRLLGEATNLHAVWDDGLLMALHRRHSTFYDDVRRAAHDAPTLVPAARGDTTADWAMASHDVAVAVVYRTLPASHDLDADYVESLRPTLEQQLVQASRRLAAVLDGALAVRP